MSLILRCLPLAVLLAACQPAPDASTPGADGDAVAAAAANGEASPEPGSASVELPEAAIEAEAADSQAPAAPPTHPALVIETLDDGTFDLANERGHWVVVNFWATWCKPCLKEIPDLGAFDASRDDVRVIGLAYEDITPEAMRDFLRKHPAGYSIALVDPYDPPADFDVPRGLPLTYLIAPDGRVAKKFLGPVTSDDLAQAITQSG